jgi:CHAD domain-containing protein
MDTHAHTRDPATPIDAPQLLLILIDQHWDNYQSERELCRNEFSSEAVRGLRIATRRMLALVQLLRRLNLGPNLQKLRYTFKDQLDGFDSLRDVQVILAEISGTIQELPGLLLFQEYLQKREKRLLRSVKKIFKQIEHGDTTKRIVKRSEILENRAIENIPIRMLHAVDEAFLITLQRVNWVNSSDSATIHSVRLAFKKFRYMVEMIHPTLENFPQENLKRMKNYQGAMGRIQDIEILLRSLSDFASSSSTFDPKPVLHLFEQRHAAAISGYLEEMHDLNNFWRAAPDLPFPWENIQ